MRESKIRAAVIGAGMIANKAHIPVLKEFSERIEVAGICSHNADTAMATARRHGIPRWYADCERMLSELRPELVCICTPNVSHKPLTLLALDYGSNVICEKPISLTYRDAKDVFEFAGVCGRSVIACQNMRYDPGVRYARDLARSGALGDIYYGDFTYIRRRGIPKWGAFHRKEANGGGCMCDLGVHKLDAMLWIMGNPAFKSILGSSAAVIGPTERDVSNSDFSSGADAGLVNPREFHPEEFDVEEFAAGSVLLENNCHITFRTSWALNLPDENEMRLAGTKAGISLPQLKLYTVVQRHQADIAPKFFDEEDRPFPGHYGLISAMADHIIDGAPLPIRPEETLNVAKIIDAFYISAAEHRVVLASELD